MGISSGVGLMTGLDIEGIISATINAESIPIFNLKKQEADFQSKISTFGSLKSVMIRLGSAAEALTDTDNFETNHSATSGDKDFITVSSTDGVTAGNYNIDVVNLATQAFFNSSEYSVPDTEIGTGTLSFQVGDGDVHEITIDDQDGHNTLEGIASLINDSDAEVSATVIKRDDGIYILSMTADKTGRDITYTYQEEGFSFTTTNQATEDEGGTVSSEEFSSRNTALNLDGTLNINGIGNITLLNTDTLDDIQGKVDALAGVTATVQENSDSGTFTLDITHDTAGESINLSFDNTTVSTEFSNLEATTTAAERAELVVNGVTLFRDDNTIDDISEGLTINLLKETDEVVNVSVTGNYSETTSKINSLIENYNEFINTLTSLQDYNAELDVGGVLQGDPTANALRIGSRNILLSSVSGINDEVNNLSKLGITMTQTGTLEFDKDVFTKKMENSETRNETIDFFTSESTSGEGFAVKLTNLMDSYTDSRDGILIAKENSYNSSIKRITSNIEAIERRLQTREQTLRNQYMNLEEIMATFNATSSYLSSQLSVMENMTKGFASR